MKNKNKITKQIKRSKKFYYNQYFTKNSLNLKRLWAGINQILNKNKYSNSNPVCIDIDVKGNVNTIADPKGIANAFNPHYATVADKILSERK